MQKLNKLFLLLLFHFSILYGVGFLMPDEAFKPYAKVNNNSIEAGVELGEDIYLYADKVKIELQETKNLKIQSIKKPQSVELHGDQVYRESPVFIITLQNPKQQAGVEDFKVKISYQGCSQQGICYEPYTKEIPLRLDLSKIPQSINTTQSSVKQNVSQTDSIALSMRSESMFWTLVSFFVFGLLLALTPCVFPMIPIISGLIISQGKGLSTKKAFLLSLVYVLAMAFAYTIAGVSAGLFGANLQAALQTPWVVYTFSLVFVALALSMFGYYELKLPDALVNKVSQSNSKHSGFIGVAIMGFLSALIVGPCVAAPLAGALVYIGQTGDALLGGLALFVMSLGMGVPLIIVGVSAGKFMPKPGGWMTMVSAIFGVMMLGVAIWMLEKVVDNSITMLLYAILGIGFALYLGVFQRAGHFVRHLSAMVLFIYSVALFVGALAGEVTFQKPLKSFQAKQLSTQPQHATLAFEVVHSLDELQKVMDANKGRKIMLDFSAQWCVACKELEEITFANHEVQTLLGEYLLIRADVTENSSQNKALSQKYSVFGPPALLFFDANHQLQNDKTIIGYIAPEEFIKHLGSMQN